MRVLSATCLFGFLLCAVSGDARHQTAGGVAQDPQAIALMKQALSALGGSVPQDSVATGTVSLIEGSKKDSGTIRVLTRGLDQSSEQIQTTDATSKETFSKGSGTSSDGSANKSVSLEWSATGQSSVFPLPLFASALSNPETAYQYVALETLDGLQVHHLRFWSTYASNPKLQALAPFTVKDLWLDAASGLPKKLSCVRRAAQGAAPGIPLETVYSDYRAVDGVLYPFSITKFLNGTQWMSISIQQVQFNTGVSEAEFAV